MVGDWISIDKGLCGAAYWLNIMYSLHLRKKVQCLRSLSVGCLYHLGLACEILKLKNKVSTINSLYALNSRMERVSELDKKSIEIVHF